MWSAIYINLAEHFQTTHFFIVYHQSLSTS